MTSIGDEQVGFKGPDTDFSRLLCHPTYCQKKKAARRAVDRARRSMEKELYRKLDENGGKKMIFMMARDRTEDGSDVKRGAVIKDNNGRLITESIRKC